MVPKKVCLLCTSLCISACASNTRAPKPSFFDRSSFPHVSISLIEDSSLPWVISEDNSSSSKQLSSVSFNSHPSSFHDTTKDYIYAGYYGPFEIGADDFEATFKYELNTIQSQTILERIRLFNASNSVVASSTKTKVDYVRGREKEVTFLVPIHDYLTNNGLTLNFEILNYESREILKTYSVKFYPPSERTVSGQYLKQNIYTSRCLGFYADGDAIRELTESFDFRAIGNYWNVDYYYRFIINQNPFLYYSPLDIDSGSYSLSFNDSDYLFPYLAHDDHDNINLPLSITRNDKSVAFSFKNYFFVNKRTLDISDTYRAGFTLTRDFYLPINGRSKLYDKQFNILINQIGLDKLTTSLPLKYDASTSLVGLCTDGEYCVSGGNRQ